MPKKKPSREEIEALFTAVRAGQVGKVRAMLRGGISPNVKRATFGETPLYTAAGAGQEKVFFALVKAGANLHARTRYGWPILQAAAGQRGTPRMVQAILEDGLQESDDLPDAFCIACGERSEEHTSELQSL